MVNDYCHLKTGSTITEYNFDAWGRRRDKDDWSYTLTGEPVLFADRGFTGHEYLPWYNLYNMNGRLYDPLVGRFLSADPFVQMPDGTQSFNRYSYCLNNPLLYIDINGYTWLSQFGNWLGDNWKPIVTIGATVIVAVTVTVLTAGMASPLAAAAIVGAASGFTSGAVGTWVNGGSFWQGMGTGGINMLIGAAAGVAGGAAAGWASKSLGNFAINALQVSGKSAIGGFVTGAIGGAAAGAAGGFVTGLAMTGDIDKALQMAGQGAIFGGIAGGLTGGYRGYKDAKALGNDPWSGAAKTGTKPLLNTGSNSMYPGDNPENAPEGFEWRGKPGSTLGSENGNWYNPNTGESLHPDLNHPSPIGPHWDYRDSSGKWWRIFPDGSRIPKL